MKKILLILLSITALVFAGMKEDFEYKVESHSCSVITWKENEYESGVDWKYYAKVKCNKKERMPVKMLGLVFYDVSINLNGEYIYTYGLEK